jgi:hypothetical protein
MNGACGVIDTACTAHDIACTIHAVSMTKSENHMQNGNAMHKNKKNAYGVIDTACKI